MIPSRLLLCWLFWFPENSLKPRNEAASSRGHQSVHPLHILSCSDHKQIRFFSEFSMKDVHKVERKFMIELLFLQIKWKVCLLKSLGLGVLRNTYTSLLQLRQIRWPFLWTGLDPDWAVLCLV